MTLEIAAFSENLQHPTIDQDRSGEAAGTAPARLPVARVLSETDRLTDVVICPPAYLAPVPSCSVTKQSMRDGHRTSRGLALKQHLALHHALVSAGVTCHLLPPAAEMPDLCFTRDVTVTTPWGQSVLKPALAHRQPECRQMSDYLRNFTPAPASVITEGKIEGGDVCIARDGLLIVGISGERTDDAGASAFTRVFEEAGWMVVLCRFDPHFLHLDTIFCMLDPNTALACTEALDEMFLVELRRQGIDVLPASYADARILGCNVLSIDGRTILASAATPGVTAMMRDRGFQVIELAISEFAACGGGIHCLTMPLNRAPTSRGKLCLAA